MYEYERNFPLPTKHVRRKGYADAVRGLPAGHSVLLPCTISQAHSLLYYLCVKAHDGLNRANYQVAADGEGTRIWCIATDAAQAVASNAAASNAAEAAGLTQFDQVKAWVGEHLGKSAGTKLPAEQVCGQLHATFPDFGKNRARIAIKNCGIDYDPVSDSFLDVRLI